MSDELKVEQCDRDLAHLFWSVHPKEIQDLGMTREQFYAWHLARHRLSALPQSSEELIERAALALVNESRRFMGLSLIASLAGLEEHRYRDQLRMARAVAPIFEQAHRLSEDSARLVTRLQRKVHVQPPFGGGSVSIGSNGKVISSTSYITDDGRRLANPDGPAAADHIIALEAKLAQATERFEKLRNADLP